MNLLHRAAGKGGVLLWMVSLGAAPALGAGPTHHDEMDYDILLDELGAALATGDSVPVTLVETYSGGHYEPAAMAGKTFTFRSGDTGGTSSHATNVSRLFFGDNATLYSQRSMAPGVTDVDIYYAGHWMGSGYLRPTGGSAAPPPVSPNHSRVASHAYLAGTSYNTLVRLDYLVDVDDYLHVVASTGGSGSVGGLGASFNAIAVGKFDGSNAENGTATVFGYPTGRHKPDLVATHGTSDSIGIVAGAAALLVDLGADASLSNGSYVPTRTGQTLQHAQSSEVVKASLMAGALRNLAAEQAVHTHTTLSDYRVDEDHRTANGLDTRFGAGRLNINHSYKIIQAGEQDSAEDAGDFGVGAYGFDYDRHFGGVAATNATASYRFATGAGDAALTATLAWNVPITFTDGSFDLTAAPDFNQIELLLFEVTQAGDVLIASSSSTIDNTQSLWLDLEGGREYLLQVRPLSGQTPFEQDYALAWRIDGWAPATVPEPATAGLLVLGLAALLGRRLSR